MDKGYENERFRSLGIKSPVAIRFRRFSRKLGKSQSMTLLAMMDFFEANGISPDQRLGETIASLEELIRRRFNAVIAIVRSIEKEQTLPTVSMIQALFEQELEDDGGQWEVDLELIERQLDEARSPKTEGASNQEITVPKIRYDRLEERMEELKRDFTYVLDRVVPINSRFGKAHLRLDLDGEEIEKYRRKLKDT